MNSFLAAFLTLVAALAWLRLLDFAAHKGWVESRLSRKIIHIGTGPIFVLCWLLFPNEPYDRFLAALIPALITLQFALIGFGIIKDDASVQAMSRTGDAKELLRGPLYYGIVFILLTLLFWKDSPVGIIALMMMCGGDGIADILGRRLASPRLPWSNQKSLAGSAGVFFGGLILSTVILAIYVAVGIFPQPLINFLIPLSIIALICTAVESLPYKDIDNITVTTFAALAGWLLF